MNKSPQCNQQQTESKQCKSEVEELYCPKFGNWPLQHVYLYLKINSGFHGNENLSEETLHI